MRSSILAVATAVVLAFSMPVFAQDAEEELVSDEVDIAMWCGAAYSVASQIEGTSEADAAAATESANAAYAQARVALEEDQIEKSEYDRLVEFYVDAAVADMTNPEAELRYTDEQCSALIAQ
ncbi:MAG TPA: hypothetical protein VGB81_13300 [Devosia sp.]|jgi:hypothetical protein